MTGWEGWRLVSNKIQVHGSISIGVPTPTNFQISSISWFETAMHPSVQSCNGDANVSGVTLCVV